MNKDYSIIKKYYGEKFSQMCRKLFPTVLETEGLLSKIILSKFAPSHFLYDDIINQNLIEDFKEYIYFFININKQENIINKTIKELLNEKDYNFYECKTEKDIQTFKKYYEKDEALCTFKGGRLNRCYVFWIVKKDIDKIKRENFKSPSRQDEYGTSVMSIQISRQGHILSIKNRYNHHVNNPDATFSNNLDNITPGLTKAFEREYGFKINQSARKSFDIINYVLAEDGKKYKYNYELNNIYYCPNNIIIDNGKIISLDKSRYLIIDYFIIDLKEKNIRLYDDNLNDSFVNNLNNIKVIKVSKKEKNKKIIIKLINKEDIIIEIDKYNRIISIDNKDIKEIGNNYLKYNTSITKINLPNLEKVGDYFLAWNRGLRKVNIPKLSKVGDSFIAANIKIDEANLPNLKEVGHYFLMFNKGLISLNLPKLEIAGKSFLCDNILLKHLNLPELIEVDNNFLHNNEKISELYLPKLKIIKDYFLYKNIIIKEINIPNIKKIGKHFLYSNEHLSKTYLPVLEEKRNKHNNNSKFKKLLSKIK